MTDHQNANLVGKAHNALLNWLANDWLDNGPRSAAWVAASCRPKRGLM